MAALVDTNVLVYRFDLSDERKRKIADDLLRTGLAENSLFIAHQAVIEFHAAVTKRVRGVEPLLSTAQATREAEWLLDQFTVLYPNEQTVRAALRATAAYQLPWFDALMWAYADTNGLTELISEDFQHGRYYGAVRALDPFR